MAESGTKAGREAKSRRPKAKRDPSAAAAASHPFEVQPPGGVGGGGGGLEGSGSAADQFRDKKIRERRAKNSEQNEIVMALP